MSYEGHCKECDAIDAQEHRRRCDGCGGLILRSEGDTSSVHVTHFDGPYAPQVGENARDYCAACTEKVKAALPVWLCARPGCGHPRHMHNAGCMVYGVPAGASGGCYCNEFVPPPGTGPNADLGASGRGKSS